MHSFLFLIQIISCFAKESDGEKYFSPFLIFTKEQKNCCSQLLFLLPLAHIPRIPHFSAYLERGAAEAVNTFIVI